MQGDRVPASPGTYLVEQPPNNASVRKGKPALGQSENGVRHKKWLEELASESNTIQAQEEIILGQEDCRPRPEKTMYEKLSVFIDISGYLCSCGLALCVVQGNGSVQVVVAARCSRKSICERLNWTKVPRMMPI